jgi:hypothetical protein
VLTALGGAWRSWRRSRDRRRTLGWVNRWLQVAHEPGLTELPKGYPHPLFCPIARALRPLGLGEEVRVKFDEANDVTTVWIGGDSHLVPAYVARFVHDFDLYYHPDLIDEVPRAAT